MSASQSKIICESKRFLKELLKIFRTHHLGKEIAKSTADGCFEGIPKEILGVISNVTPD